MHVMRLLPLVLLYVGSRSEVCESRPGQGAALLQQKSIKELFYTSVSLQEEHDDKKNPVKDALPEDLLQQNSSGFGSTGMITHLPCGVAMKLNASFSLDASCPAACPLLADPTSKSKKEFCISKCVVADQCAYINAEAPVPDEKLGSCRGPIVPGCDEHSLDGTDTCLRCGAFRVLENGKCHLYYKKTAYGVLALLVVVVLVLLWILGDLMLRPATNETNLEDALNYRSKQKFRKPDSDGTGRHLYALSTNLCNTIIGGPGLALHFRFQAVLICWAAVVAASWVLLALLTDYDLLVLGTKEFGTAFRNCVLVAWGRSTQRRLMFVKESFVIIVYIFSVVGSIIFGIQQLRFYQQLDEQNDTMKDYAVIISDLPSLAGTEPVEQELKECLETSTSQTVVGVSICWAYREQKDTIHVEMMKSLHKQQGQRVTHFQQPVEEMGPFRRRLFEIEKMILSEGEEQEVSEAELKELVQSIRSSSMAFAVFDTEQARDEAVQLLSNGLIFRDHTVRVKAATLEPHGVHWNNIDGTGFNGKLWRLAKGFVYIVLCLFLWMIIFYTPYAWAILKFNYEGGRQPGVIYTLIFSVIVCVGNLLMAEICGRVADAIGFEFKDTRENCYMVLYLTAIALNVGLDLWTTYFMATQIMVGMDFRTEDGILLADVDSFVQKFESYALQRSMGQQLLEYAWPCTFIVPFLAEPCAVIFLFSRTFMLLVGSHPELKVWECRNWLAALDLELGRYADCLVNVYLATMVFLFPGGYTQWIFFYLAVSHIYIYVYDHYRVLRVVPRATFSSMNIDFCAQALLAPACGILLVAIIFKGNCMAGSYYCLDAAPLLSTCFFAFLAHCAIHIFLLSCLVPLFGLREKGYRKDAKKYSEVAASEPCSWFSANPIHCLRSKFVFNHSPPCSYFMAGLESKMEVNESIGCFFKENAAVVEDARSYYMPKWRDVNTFLRKSTGLLSEADESTMGDTGATHSG